MVRQLDFTLAELIAVAPASKHYRSNIRSVLRTLFKGRIGWKEIYEDLSLVGDFEIKPTEWTNNLVYNYSSEPHPGGGDKYHMALLYWLHLPAHQAHDTVALNRLADQLSYTIFGTSAAKRILKARTTQAKIRSSSFTEFSARNDLADGNAVSPSIGQQVGLRPSAPFDWPPYTVTDGPKSDSAWLNPFNHTSIPFVGRDAELAKLDSFWAEPSLFSICSVIGPAGAGKTRLVSEWVKKFVPISGGEYQEGWDAGFVRSRDEAPWLRWSPKRNTIIVIDYSYNFEKVIAAIVARARHETIFKVRLLVIDRLETELFQRDVAWHSAFPTQIEVDASRQFFSPLNPIHLAPQPVDSVLIRKIIAAVAGLEKAPLADQTPVVQAAAVILYDMGKTATNADAVRHPLFAALVGQAIKEGREKGDLRTWTRRDLVKYYLDSIRRKFWINNENNRFAGEVGLWAGALVTAATLQRGRQLAVLQRHVPDSILASGTNLKPKQIVAQLAARLTSSKSDTTLPPFEPDILGETFVLDFLKDVEEDAALSDGVTRMLAESDGDRVDEQLAHAFLEVIERLARNLSNENPTEPYTVSSWLRLERFLAPARFPKGSMIRLTVSLALVELIQNHPHDSAIPLERFAELVDIDDLVDALDGPLRIEAAEAFFIAFDCADPGTKIHEAFKRTFPIFSRRVRRWLPREWNPLLLAAHVGSVRVATFVVAKKWRRPKKQIATALVFASLVGNMAFVQWAIENGGGLDFEDPLLRMTPLAAACAYGQVQVAKELVKRGATINRSSGRSEMTPLMLAAKANSAELVKLLIGGGAEPDFAAANTGWTALMIAAVFDSLDAARALSSCATLDKRASGNGMTALMGAAEAGSSRVALQLIEAGAQVNLGRLDNGTTALMEACLGGHAEVTEILLQYDCDIDKRTTDIGMSALHMAAHNGSVDCVKLLLVRGADPTLITFGGHMPSHIAWYNGHLEAYEILHEASTSWSVPSAMG